MNHKKIDELRDYYDNNDTSGEMDSGRWVVPEPEPGRMSNYSVRVPAAVLAQAGVIASTRGMTVGAWLREQVEAAVARETTEPDVDMLPMSVLLAAFEEYRHRRAS